MLVKHLIGKLSAMKSAETKQIRIDRTTMKQPRKSALLAKQIARHGEPDKWERVKLTYDTRTHLARVEKT